MGFASGATQVMVYVFPATHGIDMSTSKYGLDGGTVRGETKTSGFIFITLVTYSILFTLILS